MQEGERGKYQTCLGLTNVSMHFRPHRGYATESKKPNLGQLWKINSRSGRDSSDTSFSFWSVAITVRKKTKGRQRRTGPILGALFCVWLSTWSFLHMLQSSAIRNNRSKRIKIFQEHMKDLTPFTQANYNRQNFSNWAESVCLSSSCFATTSPVSLGIKWLKPSPDPASSMCWQCVYSWWVGGCIHTHKSEALK